METVERPCASKMQLAAWLLMQSNTKPLMEVAAAVNVSYPWLSRFKSKKGLTDNGSVDRIERLYEYLSGKTLTF